MLKNVAFPVLVCLGMSFAVGCSDGSTPSGQGGAGGSGGGGQGGAGGDMSSSTSTSTSSSGTTSSGSMSSSSGASSSSSTSTSSGAVDPLESARQECVDKINALRATKGLPPYARWKEAESCADQQATWDEMNNKPHGAWGMGLYPSCNGNGQNECLGQGVAGISGCLDSMWGEKDQAGCAGCDACAGAYNPNCPNCDFYGNQSGDVCGHYVNMSAKYFSKVACGFSALGGWDVINFSP